VVGVTDACEHGAAGIVATRTPPVRMEASLGGGAAEVATSPSAVDHPPHAWWAPHVMQVDVEWLRRERPGLVITQDAVGVSGSDGGGEGHGHVVLRALVEARLIGPRALGGSTVLLVRPRTLADVLESVVQIGAAAGSPAAAAKLLAALRARLRRVAAMVAAPAAVRARSRAGGERERERFCLRYGSEPYYTNAQFGQWSAAGRSSLMRRGGS
jgi:hypothetical protein